MSDRIPCECMDLVEIAHRDRIYPVMYCKMRIRGHIDLERLKRAVEISARYVPEILYSVDYQRGMFVNRYLTVNHVICVGRNDFDSISKWDLSVDTQLKISISPGAYEEKLTIGMSHILTDGSGFLQYLYLLSAIYNAEKSDTELKNYRDIKIVLKNAPFFKKRDYSGINKPVCSGQTGNRNYCICCPVKSEAFERLHKKVASLNMSMNDVFMAAYFRVILRRLGEKKVAIPCPADLRRRNPVSRKLTIGNMTGLYRGIYISNAGMASFDAVLCQVHKEMRRQQSEGLCFQGIRQLRFLYHKIPAAYLMQIIRKSYGICPVSYTNYGKIDDNKLHFADCDIENCYMTGTYRKVPDFQLSVSTFKNVCTLNCMLSGNTQRKTEGELLLAEIREELLNWVDSVF